MQKTCKVFGYITLILGIIGTIVLAVIFGKIQDPMYVLNEHLIRSWPLTFFYLIAGAFATGFLSLIPFALSLILEYLDYFYNKED
ncbi:MAG: hypothetical protein IJ300_05795 [Clostridia bacterium]|nr:hypothetical protein [Clostridia bacterium]